MTVPYVFDGIGRREISQEPFQEIDRWRHEWTATERPYTISQRVLYVLADVDAAKQRPVL